MIKCISPWLVDLCQYFWNMFLFLILENLVPWPYAGYVWKFAMLMRPHFSPGITAVPFETKDFLCHFSSLTQILFCCFLKEQWKLIYFQCRGNSVAIMAQKDTALVDFDNTCRLVPYFLNKNAAFIVKFMVENNCWRTRSCCCFIFRY